MKYRAGWSWPLRCVCIVLSVEEGRYVVHSLCFALLLAHAFRATRCTSGKIAVRGFVDWIPRG